MDFRGIVAMLGVLAALGCSSRSSPSNTFRADPDIQILLPPVGWSVDKSNVAPGETNFSIAYVVDSNANISSSDVASAMKLQRASDAQAVAMPGAAEAPASFVPSQGKQLRAIVNLPPDAATYVLSFPSKVNGYRADVPVDTASMKWSQEVAGHFWQHASVITVGPCPHFAWCKTTVATENTGFSCGLSEPIAASEFEGRIHASSGGKDLPVTVSVRHVDDALGGGEDVLDVKYATPLSLQESVNATVSQDVQAVSGARFAGSFGDAGSCAAGDFLIYANYVPTASGDYFLISHVMVSNMMGTQPAK